MSDPSAQTHINESRHIISEVESLRAELAEANAEAQYLRDQILRINRINTTHVLSEQVEVLATEIQRATNGTGFDTPIRNTGGKA